MALSDKLIEVTLKDVVQKIFHSNERDILSVNVARSRAEADIHLEDGYLQGGTWKEKSKAIVKAEILRLLELEDAGVEAPYSQPLAQHEPSLTEEVKKEAVRKGTKRSSGGAKAQPRKRQKRDPTPSSEEEESALTSVQDTLEEPEESDFSESPKPKKASKGAPKSVPKRGKQKADSSDEENEVAPTPVKKTSPKLQKKATPRKTIDRGNERKDDKLISDGEESEIKALGKGTAERRAVVDSESELSVVIDEPPKRKPRTTKSDPKTKSVASKKAASKVKRSSDLTPDEAEVKLLQSQLQKCGIRKIWGIELKQFSSDTKAKIRHLRQMLRSAGMEGRFSEAKAAEIKEMRELQADLEAVKEGDLKWGMGRGSRGAKNKKSTAIDIATDDDEEGEDEDSDNSRHKRRRSASVKAGEKVPRAKMDLAFLGDESDSD